MRLEVDGPAAPPRSNGELVFAEPWQSRAFAMAATLCDAGVFEWNQFQSALIERIALWESAPAGQWSYYDHWLGALEDVLFGGRPGLAADVRARAQALALRPRGHGHRH